MSVVQVRVRVLSTIDGLSSGFRPRLCPLIQGLKPRGNLIDDFEEKTR